MEVGTVQSSSVPCHNEREFFWCESLRQSSVVVLVASGDHRLDGKDDEVELKPAKAHKRQAQRVCISQHAHAQSCPFSTASPAKYPFSGGEDQDSRIVETSSKTASSSRNSETARDRFLDGQTRAASVGRAHLPSTPLLTFASDPLRWGHTVV